MTSCGRVRRGHSSRGTPSTSPTAAVALFVRGLFEQVDPLRYVPHHPVEPLEQPLPRDGAAGDDLREQRVPQPWARRRESRTPPWPPHRLATSDRAGPAGAGLHVARSGGDGAEIQHARNLVEGQRAVDVLRRAGGHAAEGGAGREGGYAPRTGDGPCRLGAMGCRPGGQVRTEADRGGPACSQRPGGWRQPAAAVGRSAQATAPAALACAAGRGSAGGGQSGQSGQSGRGGQGGRSGRGLRAPSPLAAGCAAPSDSPPYGGHPPSLPPTPCRLCAAFRAPRHALVTRRGWRQAGRGRQPPRAPVCS